MFHLSFTPSAIIIGLRKEGGWRRGKRRRTKKDGGQEDRREDKRKRTGHESVPPYLPTLHSKVGTLLSVSIIKHSWSRSGLGSSRGKRILHG